MKNFFELIGRYFMLMSKAFSRPEKFSIYRKRILVEMASLGLNSIGIVAIISVFMGAVITIDALEIMGVNSASYLILPKIIATVFFFPFLTIMSMGIGVAGGYVISLLTGAVNPEAYLTGIRYDFKPFYITYSLVKSSVFAFIITSISGFYGYYANGNSLEVGRASTKAVVVSSIVILIFNLILTQIMLT